MEPEFLTPQDGHEKQDCENAAAKPWLGQLGARYRPLGITILGDDLYCKQPVCEAGYGTAITGKFYDISEALPARSQTPALARSNQNVD